MTNRPPYPGAPRWVKVFAVVAVVVVIVVVVALLTGHGPGRHAPSPGIVEAGVLSEGVRR